ncbi:MAG: response regulator [Chroococcidiopsidaceae cyanobacterium CP_BM_RX_35]|nr:response regulator [Chroococcidiopsidaceae cyanobacterium CP_BM_RX_35]
MHLGGWHVIAATSIQEGLEKLTTERPDAILLDFLIPDELDGLQFIRQLQNHQLWQTIPIVLITAKARWFTSQQIREIGVIAKPFNPVSLPAQIAALLGW